MNGQKHKVSRLRTLRFAFSICSSCGADRKQSVVYQQGLFGKGSLQGTVYIHFLTMHSFVKCFVRVQPRAHHTHHISDPTSPAAPSDPHHPDLHRCRLASMCETVKKSESRVAAVEVVTSAAS